MGARLEVKVDGNSSGFKHTMDTVRTQAKATVDEISHSWGKGVFGGIVGALSFEGIRSAVETFISGAKEIKDMAEQLDMSTDATQKWAKAADEVGQSLNGIYSVMSAIQSKRQEALRNPGAADLFSVLGITRDQVLNEGNSEFSKRVLTAGGASDENKKILEQIVGRRGLRMIPAASRYDAAKPDYDKDAIKAAEDAEKAEKRVSSAFGRFIGGIFSYVIRSTDDSVRRERESEARIIKGEEKGGLLWRWLHRHDSDRAMQIQSQAVIQKIFPTSAKSGGLFDSLVNGLRSGASEKDLLALVKGGHVGPAQFNQLRDLNAPKSVLDALTGGGTSGGGAEDPLLGIKSQQDKEFQLRKEEAELSLHESERRNVTIAARKKSIQHDISTLNKEIIERQKAQQEGRIYGMTKEQQEKNMLPTDIQKQLQADQISLLGLQSQKAGLTNQLRDSHGFGFSADNLARVGLFSSSTLSINPMLQLGQKQLSTLEQIERNTSGQVRSPHDR